MVESEPQGRAEGVGEMAVGAFLPARRCSDARRRVPSNAQSVLMLWYRQAQSS
jgi:hypothetical protein